MQNRTIFYVLSAKIKVLNKKEQFEQKNKAARFYETVLF